MDTPEKNTAGQARKPYHSPVIHYYGAIRTITENIGKTSKITDGGGGNMSKTA